MPLSWAATIGDVPLQLRVRHSRLSCERAGRQPRFERDASEHDRIDLLVELRPTV
jgi:hypothetical protein